jgi:ABC-type lipopolysaccharide export system ATPase subunit
MAVMGVSKLTKHYGKLKAVEWLSLRIVEVSGFLGPNGVGKISRFACSCSSRTW